MAVACACSANEWLCCLVKEAVSIRIEGTAAGEDVFGEVLVEGATVAKLELRLERRKWGFVSREGGFRRSVEELPPDWGVQV